MYVFLLDAVNLKINQLLMLVDEQLLLTKDSIDQLFVSLLNPLPEVIRCSEAALHLGHRRHWHLLQSCQRWWQNMRLGSCLSVHGFFTDSNLFRGNLCLGKWDRYLNRLAHHQGFCGFCLDFQRLG